MKKYKKMITACLMFIAAVLVSCSAGPKPIEIGVDACDFCKMSISDARFGAELLTKKGKVYKFDDLHCLLGYLKELKPAKDEIKDTYIVDFNKPNALIELSNIKLFKSSELRSPMGSNIAGFSNETSLNEAKTIFSGEPVAWNDIFNK